MSGVVSLSSITNAHAQSGLGGRPSEPNPAIPRSSSIFIHTLEAGSVIDDMVLVSNDSDEEQTIELYPTDGMATGTGAFSCRQQAEERKSVGDWIQLGKSDTTLELGEQKEVPFTIRMPQQVDVGEHNGCIVFQAKAQETDESQSMHLRFRSAVRVAITVPGDIRKDLSIDSLVILRDGEGYIYRTVVNNAGNVSTDADIRVVLESILGDKTYENGGEYPILADEPMELQFKQEQTPFWGGFYTVTVTATYDTNPQAFGVKESGSLATIDGPRKTVFIAPSPIALILYLTILFLIAFCMYCVIAAHNRHKKQAEWNLYTVRKGDTLISLAEARATHWKRIARANKLKPPYQVKAGDSIRLPPYKTNTKP